MPDNILFEIKKIDILAMQNLMKGKELGKHPSPTQMRIMRYMAEHQEKDVYQKDLEQHLNLSRATISDVLNTMEKNEIIERVSDEVDTRTKKVMLTKKATELHDEAKQEVDFITERMVKNITEEDMKTFRKVLKQMEDNLK